MKTVAIIPARGGSERIPRKNLAEVCGRSLLEWTVLDALSAPSIDRVVVTSDDDAILARAAGMVGVTAHKRPAEWARADSMIEGVILDVLESYPCDRVVLLNCCCPLRSEGVVEAALKAFRHCCMFSACDWSGLTWEWEMDTGDWTPSYDPGFRPQSQDWPVIVRETGSFWIFGADHVAKRGSMICRNAVPFMVDQLDTLDIDTEKDLERARQLLPVRRGLCK